MDRRELDWVMEEMGGHLGVNEILQEIISYISTDDLEDALRHIDRMWDIGIFDELECEEDDEEDEE